jgi:tRNA-specific 2-thiouridylase
MGEHQGLMYYTLGQRQGLMIGGHRDHGEQPWYVVGKNLEDNALIVAQGEHEMLFSDTLAATDASWIGSAPEGLDQGLRCKAKIRYRQSDQDCLVTAGKGTSLEVRFDDRQKAVAPGQFVVFYTGDLCLGGAVIDQCW